MSPVSPNHPVHLRGSKMPRFRPSKPLRGFGLLSLGLGLLLWNAPLEGQIFRGGESRTLSVADRAELLRFLNSPSTLRWLGGGRIPQGTAIQGDMAVLGGTLTLGGEVSGELVVVNADLRLEPGARVSGGVRIYGGVLVGEGNPGWHGDRLEVGLPPVRFRLRGDQVEFEDPESGAFPTAMSAEVGQLSLRPVLRTAGSYNRVEGLPVFLGGKLSMERRNSTSLEGGVVWRSVSGLDLEEENLGHLVQLTQNVGGRGEGRLGITRFERIRPIEDQGLTSLESSLSTLLLRRDPRDHLEEEGWSLWFEGTPLDYPVRTRVSYEEVSQAFAPVRSPLTLRGSDRPWRPQPLVAEGRFNALGVQVELDTRNDPSSPSDGWWATAELRRQVGGGVSINPGPYSDGSSYGLATEGSVDLRRYVRIGPDARLNTRLFVAGSLNGEPLPPQRQRALGGEGSLPGHPRFALDCGARAETLVRPGFPGSGRASMPVYPAYGCDGVALGQVEFQGRLPREWRPGAGRDRWEVDSLFALRPTWSVFMGAGRGWAHEPASPALLEREDSPLRADMGVGLFVGPLSLYWAWPLNRSEQGINFFVRLSHLF
jgi:hypothetical protein